MIVELSKRSQELLQSYLNVCEPSLTALGPIVPKVQVETLLKLLQSQGTEKQTKNLELITAALGAELLKDLRLSLPDPVALNLNEEATTPWFKKTKFILLVLLGVFVAACEGFDGVTTILSFLALPSLWVFLAGLAFSVLSVILFCGYDLIQLSRYLGISIMDGPKILNNYVKQVHEIKYIRRQIEIYRLVDLSKLKLIELTQIIDMLQIRLLILSKVSAQFDAALKGTTIKIIKGIFSALAAMLFFGGGFFAGQSVAVFVFGLIATSIPALWPVVVFSCLVGLAALAVYWYMERPGLQKLIPAWIGLDEDKIEQLCDKEKIEKEDKKLVHLKNNVAGILHLKAGAREELSLISNRYSFYRSFIREKTEEDADIEADFVLI